MSNIRVNTTELMQMLEMTPAHHNLMLVGRHGIGKSEILTEYYAGKGLKVGLTCKVPCLSYPKIL